MSFRMAKLNINVLNCHHEFFLWKRSWYHNEESIYWRPLTANLHTLLKAFGPKMIRPVQDSKKWNKLCSQFKTQDPENYILFRCTYQFRPKRWPPGVGHSKAFVVRSAGRHFFRLSPGRERWNWKKSRTSLQGKVFFSAKSSKID